MVVISFLGGWEISFKGLRTCIRSPFFYLLLAPYQSCYNVSILISRSHLQMEA